MTVMKRPDLGESRGLRAVIRQVTRLVANTLLVIGIGALTVFAIMPFLGQHWWIGDLFSHFRFHYLVAGASVLFLTVSLRRWRTLAVVTLLLMPHVFAIMSPDHAHWAKRESMKGERLRVASINLQWNNRTQERAIAFIRRANADLVLVQEATKGWHKHISALRDTYPYIAPANWRIEPQNILLCRYPIRAHKVHPGRLREFNFLEARVITAFGALTVVGIHPPYPLSARLFRLQQDELSGIIRVAKSSTVPVIVAGDFNLTPYSPRFRAVLSDAGLVLVGQRSIWPRTWPTRSRIRLPLGFIPGIPIDNILVSPNIAVATFRRGHNVGSDHYPIVADIVVRRSN